MYQYVGKLIRIKEGLSTRIDCVWGVEVLVKDVCIYVTRRGEEEFRFKIEFLEDHGSWITKGHIEPSWKEWEFEFPPLEHAWEV